MESGHESKSTSRKARSGGGGSEAMGKARALTTQRVVCTLARLQLQFPGGVPLRDLITELSERYHVKNTGDRIKNDVRRLLSVPVRLGFVSKAGSWYRVTRAPRQLARRSSRMWRCLGAMMRQYEAQLQHGAGAGPFPLPPKEYADGPDYARARGAAPAPAPPVFNWASGETALPAGDIATPPPSAVTSSASASASASRRRGLLQGRGDRGVPYELAYAAAAAAASRQGARKPSAKVERCDSAGVAGSRENGPDRTWTAIIHTHSGQKVVQLVPPDSARRRSASRKRSRSRLPPPAAPAHSRRKSPNSARSARSARSGRSARSASQGCVGGGGAGVAGGAEGEGGAWVGPLGGARRFPVPRASLSSFGRRSLSLSSSSDRPRVYKPTRQDVINSQRRRIRARLEEERREHARQEAQRRRELERRHAERWRFRHAYWRGACTASSVASAAPPGANMPIPGVSPPAAVAAAQRATLQLPTRSALHLDGLRAAPAPALDAAAASRRASPARERSAARRRSEGGGAAASSADVKSSGVRPRSAAAAGSARGPRSRAGGASSGGGGGGWGGGGAGRARDAADLERLLPPSVLGLMRDLSPTRCSSPRVHQALAASPPRNRTPQHSGARGRKGAGQGQGSGLVVRVSPKRGGGGGGGGGAAGERSGDKSPASTPSLSKPSSRHALYAGRAAAQSPARRASRALHARAGDTRLADAVAWETRAPRGDADADLDAAADPRQAARCIYVGKPLPRHKSFTFRFKTAPSAESAPPPSAQAQAQASSKSRVRATHSVGMLKREAAQGPGQGPGQGLGPGRGAEPRGRGRVRGGPGAARGDASRSATPHRPPSAGGASAFAPASPPASPQSPVGAGPPRLGAWPGAGARGRPPSASRSPEPRRRKPPAPQPQPRRQPSDLDAGASRAPAEAAAALAAGAGAGAAPAEKAGGAAGAVARASPGARKYPRPWAQPPADHEAHKKGAGAGAGADEAAREKADAEAQTEPLAELAQPPALTSTATQMSIDDVAPPPAAHKGKSAPAKATASKLKASPATMAFRLNAPPPPSPPASPSPAGPRRPRAGAKERSPTLAMRNKSDSGRRRRRLPVARSAHKSSDSIVATRGEAGTSTRCTTASVATSTTSTVGGRARSKGSARRASSRSVARTAPPTPAETPTVSEAETISAPAAPACAPAPPGAAGCAAPAAAPRKARKSFLDVPMVQRQMHATGGLPWVGAGGEHSEAPSPGTAAAVAVAAAAAALRSPATHRMARRSVLTAAAAAAAAANNAATRDAHSPVDLEHGKVTESISQRLPAPLPPLTSLTPAAVLAAAAAATVRPPAAPKVALPAAASPAGEAPPLAEAPLAEAPQGRRPPSRNGAKRSADEPQRRPQRL